MIKLSFGILLCLITGALFSQDDAYHYYRITADNVNVRKDTGLNSKVMMKASFGQEFSCRKVDSIWYECQSGLGPKNNYYISSKFIGTDDQLILDCESKNRKDLSTLLILEHLYANNGDYDKAVKTSIEITNLYRNNLHPTREELCALYRELPCYSKVRGVQNTTKYKTSIISDYCTQLINESHDSLLVTWAIITRSRCYAEAGMPELSIELLLKAINAYGKYLIIPEWCHYSDYIAVTFMGATNQITFRNALNKICYDPKANAAAKAIACNIMLMSQW